MTNGKYLHLQHYNFKWLTQMLAEVVDLLKMHGQVYGVGPGGALDKEIQTYMRFKGVV